MKIVEKNNDNKRKLKKKHGVKPKKEHVLIIAQEIKFARLLSGNEKKTRDRALKTLKKWLMNCFAKNYEFKEDDFSRIWKGLFYAVWMSDKPLVQEELCENIAEILDLFPTEQVKHALLMVKVGFRTLATEWYGIDHHRMDKCLMLVRRYLRGSLRYLHRCGWSLKSCKMYSKMLTGPDGILAPNTPLYARNAQSMILHVIDCYLEEIAKVSGGELPASSLAAVLRPLCQLLCGRGGRGGRGERGERAAAAHRALTQLLRQSGPGLSYRERTRAWEKMGCPPGGPDALVSDDEDEAQASGDEGSDDEGNSSGTALDPRAGRVDVVLPLLPVPCEELAGILREMMVTAEPKAQKRARLCLQRFEQLARDEYPLRIKASPVEEVPRPRPLQSARELQALEKTLVAASDELALRGLSRKHRKRLLAKSRSGLSIVEDMESAGCVSGKSANGDWSVEETEPQKKKMKQENSSNKENLDKSKAKKKRRRERKQNGDHATQNGDVKKAKENMHAKTNTNKVTNEIKLDVTSKENRVTKKKVKTPVDKLKLNDKNKNSPNFNSDILKLQHKNKNVPFKKDDKSTNAVKTKVNDNPSNKTVVVKNDHRKTEKNVKANPTVVVNRVKHFQKQLSPKTDKSMDTPKRVKFVLKNNSMQGPVDYYKSVRQSPSIPFDSSKIPIKTNLKPSTPSPINPFFKKKLKIRH